MASIGEKMAGRLKRFAEALDTADRIPQRFTRRTIKLDLQPTAYDPKRVKKARDTLRASQAIFAQFLGVSTKTVQDWEQGLKRPRSIARRLMDEILRDPNYWRERLLELATPATTS